MARSTRGPSRATTSSGRTLADFARREGIPVDAPWATLTAAQRDRLLNATTSAGTAATPGILPFLERLEAKRYKQYIRVFLRQYQSAQTCPACHGAKLRPKRCRCASRDGRSRRSPSCRRNGCSSGSTRSRCRRSNSRSPSTWLGEARGRVRFLCDVGLDLPLAQPRRRARCPAAKPSASRSRTRSARRLVDTLYVLDEPSIGLHPRDMDRLLRLLIRLRDAGNTVLVVEHDLEAIRRADYMVELGPGSGTNGGTVVFAGPISRAAESPLTGQYLTGARQIPLPAERRRARSAVADAHRRARAQPPRCRHPDPDRRAHRRDGGVGVREEHARARRAVPRARDAAARRAHGQASTSANGSADMRS